jgi:voltage-gated potassium channel
VIIVASLEEYRNTHIMFLVAFNIFSIFIFSIEYVLRLWTCTCNPEYKKPLKGTAEVRHYSLRTRRPLRRAAVLPAVFHTV